jgi:hypothetical protein
MIFGHFKTRLDTRLNKNDNALPISLPAKKCLTELVPSGEEIFLVLKDKEYKEEILVAN